MIWAAWHFPVILRGYDYGRDQAVLGCGALTVSCILLAFIFAWLVERAGSIWASSLAHAATNAIGGSLTFLWFASATIWPLHPTQAHWRGRDPGCLTSFTSEAHGNPALVKRSLLQSPT